MFGIALDKTNVYWVDGNSLRSVPIEGGASDILVGNLSSPRNLSNFGDKLFWREYTGDVPVPDNWELGCIKSFSKKDRTTDIVLEELSDPYFITAVGDYLYWTEGGNNLIAADGLSKIARLSFTTGKLETIFTGINSDRPSLAVDDSNVYVGDGFTIKKISLAESTVDMLVYLPYRLQMVFGSPWQGQYGNLASDGQFLYWIDDRGEVYKVPVDGGEISKLVEVSQLKGKPMGFKLHGSYLYWKVGGVSGEFKRVPINGGEVETLIAGLPSIYQNFIIDDEFVYLVDNDQGQIYKFPVTGGDLSSFSATRVWSRTFLADDSDTVYMINEMDMMKAPKNGGSKLYLFRDGPWQSRPYSLVTDETSLYFAVDRGEIWRVSPK